MRRAAFGDFLTRESRGKLKYLAGDLHRQPEGRQSLWIPDGLEATRSDGASFPAEATLSRFEVAPAALHAHPQEHPGGHPVRQSVPRTKTYSLRASLNAR